jgi:gluconate 5-dehydrogenase
MDKSTLLFSLAEKVAVVTGASSGLGRRAAEVLTKSGARVVGVARRAEALENLALELGENFSYICADISDRSILRDLSLELNKKFGAPDILVHAAGVNTRQTADEVTYLGWDQTISLNLSTPFFLSQLLVPGMKKKGWGRIVNFASLQTARAFPGGIAYGASKAAIGQLTRAMAEAWSTHGICVNAIGPGFFPTELTQAVFDDEERSKKNAEQTCIGRNGEMEDLDGPLLFLCSEASRYVTGQVLMVDGGFTAK